MIPYKQISENLTTNEFNGIVSLLRNNVNFDENIRIRNSTVAGEFGSYQFNFNDATIVDNGVLITNETSSTIGTVKLVNPVFPHSNYFIDLKVYSTEEIHIGDFGDNDEGILVTELTVPLKKDVDVNIPFETLDINNIVGFDAVVRINHKDLVINTGDHLELTANSTAYLKVPTEFTARYLDGAGFPVEGASVSFYEGETFLGSGVSDSEGYVVVEHTFMSLGVHNVFASSSNVFSRNVSVEVINNVMELGISGSSFSTNSSNPFTYNGRVYVDWGDDTGLEEYTGGKLSHTFNDGLNNHGVRVYGGLTILRSSCFYGCTGLTSINIPSSVTALGFECFRSCTGLTSINIPSSVTALGPNCFRSCTGLTSINIPSSVTHLESYCFNGCTGLTSINLNWETSTDILSYKSDWISECPAFQYFIIPEGTKQLYITKGYPANLLREDVSFDDFTFTERTGKQILSQADGDKAYLDVQLTSEGSAVAVEGVDVEFYNGSTLIDTVQTDSTGKATYEYTSVGAGDIEFGAKPSSLVSKTYSLQDCFRYDDASTDKTSSYASPLVYRGSGNGAWNYNSTNGYYGTISGSNEVMIPLSELTGKDDLTIEFDALLNANSTGEWGIAGICAYENNDNYSRLSCHGRKIAQRVSVNGSANESESDVLTTVRRYDILHYKFTISNNQIIEEVTRGTTLIGTRTISYTPTSNTKYGFALIWSNNWVKDTFIKNIKIKPL